MHERMQGNVGHCSPRPPLSPKIVDICPRTYNPNYPHILIIRLTLNHNPQQCLYISKPQARTDVPDVVYGEGVSAPWGMNVRLRMQGGGCDLRKQQPDAEQTRADGVSVHGSRSAGICRSANSVYTIENLRRWTHSVCVESIV